MHDHETDEVADRSPNQIHTAIAHRDVILAIDGTGDRGEGGPVLGEVLEADLIAVDPGAAFATRFGRDHRSVGHRVAFGTRHEMMPLGQERANDLASRVIGIGHKQNLAIPGARY